MHYDDVHKHDNYDKEAVKATRRGKRRRKNQEEEEEEEFLPCLENRW